MSADWTKTVTGESPSTSGTSLLPSSGGLDLGGSGNPWQDLFLSRDAHIGRNAYIKGPRPWHDVRHSSFGALGDDSTNDTAAFQAAHDALPATGGIIFVPEGIYRLTQVNITKSNTWILGAGPGSVLKMTGSTQNSALNIAGTGLGTAANLDANSAEGDLTLVLVAGGVAGSGLAAGDLLVILDSSTNQRHQVTRVIGIASETVTISDPTYEAFTTANTARVQELTALTGVRVSRLKIDGNLNTGTDSRGIMLKHAAFSEIEDVTVTGTTGAGVYFDTGYRNHAKNLRTDDCGSATESDIEMRRQTGFTVNGIQSTRASGFGPQLVGSNACTLSNIISVGANGRGMKVATCGYNTFTNVQVHAAVNTYTGFSLVDESHRNLITNLHATMNGAAGIWLEGTGDNYNWILNSVSVNNATRDLELGAGATGNVFFNIAYVNLLNSGTDTAIVQLHSGVFQPNIPIDVQGNYVQFQEITPDPAAPAANFARLFAKDNGAGKTQIVARFPTGATQVLATEP